MQHQWIKRSSDAAQIIVFFGGWAIGAEAFAHLRSSADILYISDYRDLEANLPELHRYEKRVLVAWSFGVASYCHWQQGRADIFDRKIAINGSMTPIDRLNGIPPLTLQKTIDSLSSESFQVFLTRCYGEKQPHYPIDLSTRKAELLAVQMRDYTGAAQNWDKVWISRHDKIFPFANMQRAWHTPIKVLDGPHVPFAAWTSWDEVIA